MFIPILATKLYIPSPRPKIVLRSRLIERLDEGLHGKLTLISAPAGFGKTTLVSEWVSGCRQSVAWLSLDKGDNDPARFVTYFVAALQTLSPQMGAGMVVAIQSPQPPSIESILTTLLNEIAAIPGNFILVLDDYHTIEAPSVAQALTFLIEHQPQNMHLVIATREDPPLPLARYRVRGQLAELRAADLRFTPAEAAEFLNQAMGLNLSGEDITTLETRTEGWIAGLQLAALALQGLATQGHSDAASFIQSFTGSHHFVLDFLLEEVLEKQSESIKAFLLRTSILDRLCGPLCDAVLGFPSASGQETVGQATLEYLERSNLFTVPLDNERRWYRYHHLFGNLLRQRLGQNLTPGEIAELHIRASEWYETNGWMLEAFRHAAAANDVERAERLMESKGMGLHLRSVTTTILDWLDTLPASVLDARPLLRVRSATLALMAWRIAGVGEKLLAAEAALQKFELDARTRDLTGQIACARATLALTRYDPQTMLAQARRALEYLSPENNTFLFTANWALATANLLLGDRLTAAQACQQTIAFSQKSGSVFSKILATIILGNLQKLDNQLHQAAETYRRVLELSGDNPHPNAGTVQLNLAEICYEWNDLEAAERHAQRSLQLMQQYDMLIDRFILCEVFQARLKLARGDVEGAAAMLAGAERSARQQNFLQRLPDIAAIQVLVLIRQRQLAAAAQLARQYELPLSQARVLIAQDDPSTALAVLEPVKRQMQDRRWVDELLKTLVLQAVALHSSGEKDQAVQVLGEALALAEPGGFIRLFVDEGAPMQELLTTAASQGIWPDYASKLLAVFEPETGDKRSLPSVPASSSWVEPENQPAESALVDPLTPRELEVLRLIAQGLSNQEIGNRLFLALDTVKGHNRRIFDKLQVQRRTEAIARARALGLV